jgi:pyruvate dehydrogenase E1 component alpha subunit
MTQAAASRRKKPPLDREHGLYLLHEMLRIRRFEEKAAEVYSLGKIRGFLHLYIGEEACAVGAMQALTPDDAVVASYRDHGQALARGLPPGELMAEMYGKTTGCSRGRGGSMHFFDVSRRFYGGNGIVAGGLPIALGLALADSYQQKARVTACFFGDGAVVEGEFHECMNLASLWHLPVLFVCENNLYGMGTAIEKALARTDIAAKADAYGIPAEVADGMQVLAVEETVRRAAEAVRAGEGPRFVELKTYRFRAHSMADPDLYRTKEEIEGWRERDPIDLFVALLRKERVIDDAGLAEIEARVAAEIDEATAFADAGPVEPLEDLLKDVYTGHFADAKWLGGSASHSPTEGREMA